MNYGPKLTPGQIAKLQKETAEFNEKETLAEIERAATGGKDIDAYHKWVEENGGREPVEANPDQLTEDCGQPWGQTQLKDTTGLSELERDAWELCKEMGYSAADAARELGTTLHALNSAIKRARQKLKGQL